MNVAFGTNVILNAAMGRDGSEYSQKLIQAVISGEITGIVTANTITDIHYIVKKRAGDKAAREVVRNTLNLFDVVPVNRESCEAALVLPMSDYEDAVLAVCANEAYADYIATQDEGFINSEGSPVAPLHPQDILCALQEPEE